MSRSTQHEAVSNIEKRTSVDSDNDGLLSRYIRRDNQPAIVSIIVVKCKRVSFDPGCAKNINIVELQKMKAAIHWRQDPNISVYFLSNRQWNVFLKVLENFDVGGRILRNEAHLQLSGVKIPARYPPEPD